LNLPEGLTLLTGKNGHGKSNLLEALYLLAMARSARASIERELINHNSAPTSEQELTYAKVSANTHNGELSNKIEIHYRCLFSENKDGFATQKYIRINGSPKRSSDLIGTLNAVLFTADDLDIVFGNPTVRRRYLDILISQIDKHYLEALKRYQEANRHRNHLLRSIREGVSTQDELQFWDDQLAQHGCEIIKTRMKVVDRLSELLKPFHMQLDTAKESLQLLYRHTIPGEEETPTSSSILVALEKCRAKDIAQGSTSVGPQRDDMSILINQNDASRYASRGQARTAVLALKLAESTYLKERRGSEPLLLLDDLLSELDATRRRQIMEHITQYQQCIVTSAELDSIPNEFVSVANNLLVDNGTITSA